MVSTVDTGLRKFTDKANHSLLHFYDVDTLSIERVNGHHGMPHVVDYLTAVGLGKVAGHSIFRGLGRRDSLSTGSAGNDIWEGVAATFVYPNQTTGEQCTLVSTSAQDSAAGTGAQQIDVHYLDATGAQKVETVTMNGTTPVNTIATNIRFIQYIHTQRITSGAIGNTTAGNITIYSTATPANIFNFITAGGNISLSSQRMVPAGLTFYMNYISASSTSSKPISVRLRATCDFEGTLTPGIFIYNELFELQDSSVIINLQLPRIFPALCIIKGTAYSTTAGGTASLSYGGWME